LTEEVFGPVLHVVRYRADRLGQVLQSIERSGYGLTLGIHSRIDDMVEAVIDRLAVGNIYVNRNMIGAVVGVQPFGGEGLSGTGPKAGGALYLQRLLAKRPTGLPKSLESALIVDQTATNETPAALTALRDWAIAERDPQTAARCEGHLQHVMTGATAVLAGPTGERNTYTLGARGTVLCVASTASGARAQLAAVLATGNKALFSGAAGEQLVAALPASIKPYASTRKSQDAPFDAVLFEGDSDELMALVKDVAKRPGPIVSVQGVPAGAFADDAHDGEQEYAL
jgi:RHH-type proline utilization regulon transcriptional repressor/proline dehydrogenase/delta 1-pyrroline-5-carboxylate dehydrogenase